MNNKKQKKDMCVIMCKPAGVECPPFEEIKNCMDNNSDGFGVMWSAGDKVHVFKTMKQKEMESWWKKVLAHKESKDISIVFHARIKTHGTPKVANCHPWTNEDGIGFCHNGILSISNRDDMTDSETFFRDLWTPAFKYGGKQAAERAVKAVIGTSKFCFLYPDGTVQMYGVWDKGGKVKEVYYSNTSYEKRSWTLPSHGSNYYGQYYDDCYFGSRSKKTTSNTERIQALMQNKCKRLGDKPYYAILKEIWDNHKDLRSYNYEKSDRPFAEVLAERIGNNWWQTSMFKTWFKDFPLNNMEIAHLREITGCDSWD